MGERHLRESSLLNPQYIYQAVYRGLFYGAATPQDPYCVALVVSPLSRLPYRVALVASPLSRRPCRVALTTSPLLFNTTNSMESFATTTGRITRGGSSSCTSRKLRLILLYIRLFMTKPLLNTMPRLVIVSPRLLSIR